MTIDSLIARERMVFASELALHHMEPPLMKDQMAGRSASVASLTTMASGMVADGRGSPTGSREPTELCRGGSRRDVM